MLFWFIEQDSELSTIYFQVACMLHCLANRNEGYIQSSSRLTSIWRVRFKPTITCLLFLLYTTITGTHNILWPQKTNGPEALANKFWKYVPIYPLDLLTLIQKCSNKTNERAQKHWIITSNNVEHILPKLRYPYSMQDSLIVATCIKPDVLVNRFIGWGIPLKNSSPALYRCDYKTKVIPAGLVAS